MALLKNAHTRCNFCSLGCVVTLAETARGAVAPDYGHDTPEMRRGLNNRGNITAELLRHARRVVSARLCSGGKCADARLEDAVRIVADAVRASGAALLIDGNLPCEDVAAALALAAGSNGKLSASVYLPPEDEAALDGVAASGAALLTPEDLADCDAILVVGDAFATHPLISRPVHDARKRNPRLPLVVVDSIPGRTSIFANAPVVVKPGAESRALAALAAKCGVGDLGALAVSDADAGASAEALANAARMLGGAKKLGVILRAEVGKAPNWDQAAFLAGKLASAKGGGLTLCLTYGNAMGSYRLARAYMAQPPSAGGTAASVLVALGGDPATTLSKKESAALDGLKLLVAANAMPVPTMGRAGVALPMAFNFEAGGTTMTGSGEAIEVNSVADAPCDACSAGALAEALAKALGIPGVARGFSRAAIEKMPAADAGTVAGRPHPVPASAPVGEFLAVTHGDAIHFHTGSLTSMCAWPAWAAATPLVMMSAPDAAALGVKHHGRVLVVSGVGQCEAEADVSKIHPAGVVAVSSGFAASRGLFPWSGSRRTGPTTVRLQKA